MDMEFKNNFIQLWKKYFDNAELPMTFYYTEEEGHAQPAKPGTVPRCVIGALQNVRKGESYCFDTGSIGCFGGKRYLGFAEKVRPNFEYFLSCGIPGQMEGERYKKSPELVKELMKKQPVFKAPAKYIVFKRWDMLEESDNPDVVIFFARPDVMSGLFTLCGFDESEPNGVIAPFGAGCASIVQNPYLEKDSYSPKGIIGMFDVSARPYVCADELTFAAPMNKFERMVGNMEESFLITESWKKMQKRISIS
ncbi:hypothetical protein METP3_02685 [Methanosarcinales archaeon]|nr:hypothetical protein METP3_02685 [Methanosarcinales archaeon]